jgi:hypothetical protein
MTSRFRIPYRVRPYCTVSVRSPSTVTQGHNLNGRGCSGIHSPSDGLLYGVRDGPLTDEYDEYWKYYHPNRDRSSGFHLNRNRSSISIHQVRIVRRPLILVVGVHPFLSRGYLIFKDFHVVCHGLKGVLCRARGDKNNEREKRKERTYSRTPLNPYPFGGLLGYWLDELRLKKKVFGGMG